MRIAVVVKCTGCDFLKPTRVIDANFDSLMTWCVDCRKYLEHINTGIEPDGLVLQQL